MFKLDFLMFGVAVLHFLSFFTRFQATDGVMVSQQLMVRLECLNK